MQNTSKQKSIIFIAIALVVVIVLSLGIAMIFKNNKTPVSSEYITVTIDNSMSAVFTLDKNDYSVLSAETLNKADGFLVESVGKRISFSQAINSLLKEMLKAQKLLGTEGEVLLFAVESVNQDDFEQLANSFRNALLENDCDSRVYTLYFKVKEDKTVEFAERHNTTYAKAHLCKKLEKEHRKLNADELVSLSVTEIVQRVNQLAKEELLDKIQSETNEEQKNEQLVSTPNAPVSSDTSSNVSSEGTSSNTSSDTSSDISSDTSSDTSSDDTSSGPTFTTSDDDSGWVDIY